MSTKISIAAGPAFHLYEELFYQDNTEVFLKIEDPTGIVFERCWEDQKESVTVSIPAEVMDRIARSWICLLYTSPSPRDRQKSRMPSSA